MRISIFGVKTLPAYAGADRVVERLLDHFPAEYDCTIYLVRSDDAPALTCTANRHYVYIPALSGKHLRAFSFFLGSALHFLLKGRADVAHVHNSDFGLFCPLLRLKRGVRVVGTFHGHAYQREKWGAGAKAFLRVSEWLFVRSCDALTSVSPLEGPSRSDVRYIPNGVDPWIATGDGAFPFEDHGLRRGEYVLFACGRLDATKGLHHLLRAYRDVTTDRKLLVVGDFSHDPAYADQIRTAAAEDARVVLHEQLLDRASLFGVLAECTAFVFPSDVEAMSMMLLEAISSGRPVVCSDIPANTAIVGDEYANLFPAGDAAALASVLEGVLADPATGERDAAVLGRVAERFRWPDIVRQYTAVFEPAVGA